MLSTIAALGLPAQTLTTLFSFDGADGAGPRTLVQAASGNVYGATYGGGSHNLGTVFRIGASGRLTTLHSFCVQNGCLDGQNPGSRLVQVSDGDFYGTTEGGGANGSGTIFKITANGILTTLYSFCAQSGCADGAVPTAGLVQGTDGDFYGTTNRGGSTKCIAGCGTVFKITPSGTLTTLHAFCAVSGCTDGAEPQAGVLEPAGGDFYGTPYFGGASNCYGVCGTLFRITPSGALATLHTFCGQSGCADGANPYAGLVQAAGGDLYGATAGGGAPCSPSSGCGTLFSLSVGLGPFVETRPAAGKAGQTVEILGTNLTGASSVSFNGTPAVFHMVSISLIATTVPADAGSGTVQVVTKSGTLSSNVPFRVLP